MAKQRRCLPTAIVLLAFVASRPTPGLGYANDGPGGGPHRRINALALSRFIRLAAEDPILKLYDFRPTIERYGLPASSRLFQVKSETVTKAGSWHRGETLWPGAMASFIEEGDVLSPFAWWVEEGGFTADEPESYMAMRHFYDPLARGTDAETGKKAAYLTDALDAWMSPLLMGHNPRMDAKTWAVSDSPYSFLRGRDGLEYIAAMDFADADRGKEFGAVWRSLGETLHLLADMTVPAHVRNDAHPGAWIKKTLAGDPYEDYVDADVVSRCAAGPSPDAVRAALEGVEDPGVLMHAVALFTNRHFFSKDTISGRDGVTGGLVAPANGQPAYPAPKLEFYEFEPSKGGWGFYQTPNRLFAAAGRDGKGNPTIGSPTVTGQALALIPAAVESAVKMIDLFMPRLRVTIDGFDADSNRLSFRALRLSTDASGLVPSTGPAANLWSSPEAVVILTLGGARRTALVRIEAGTELGLSLNLSAMIAEARKIKAESEAPSTVSAIVGIDMGGILVKSEPFELALPEPPPTPPKPPTDTKPEEKVSPLAELLRKCVGVQATVYGKFNAQGTPLTQSHNEFHGGNYDFFTRQKLRYEHPLKWQGRRFSATYSISETRPPTASQANPIATETVSITGEISEDGRTLVSLVTVRTNAYPGESQKETIRLTNVPFESRQDEAGHIEIVFRSNAAGSVSAEYVHTVDNDPLRYYNWTASTGDGTFDMVRVWFVN
jgi:hypothetical protein